MNCLDFATKMKEQVKVLGVRIVALGRRDGSPCCWISQSWSVRNLVVILAIFGFQSCQAQGDIDERCFLQTGGSTASFFVKEDLKVGSLVGQMR